MDIDTDVLIIGGGMAGLVAGIRSLETGVRATIVRKGQSATAHSSGAIDIAGYLPGGISPLLSAREGIQAITGLYPLHPYSILAYSDGVRADSSEQVCISKVKHATDWLSKHLVGTPSQLIGSLDANQNGISLLGTQKPTAFVQLSMWSGDLFTNDNAVLLFLGIKGLPILNVKTAAKAFLDNQTHLGTPPHKVASMMIDVKPFDNDYNLSTTNIARHLDDEEALRAIEGQIKTQAEKVDATHIGLPPVLGLEENLRNQRILQEASDAKVFELLAFPPSVPGIRLQRSLDKIFIEKGGTLLIGHEVTPSEVQNRQVTSVIARSPRRRLQITTKSTVLASGKYIGGGLGATGEGLFEPIFDLMTVTEGFRQSGETRPQLLTNLVSMSPHSHPLLGCGLSVDQCFRPVNHDGHVTAENLFAAGSVLAGYNYSMEKSGLGVALVTGYYAGENAAKAAKEGGA